MGGTVFWADGIGDCVVLFTVCGDEGCCVAVPWLL